MWTDSKQKLKMLENKEIHELFGNDGYERLGQIEKLEFTVRNLSNVLGALLQVLDERNLLTKEEIINILEKCE